MIIALTGTHSTGKSSLVTNLQKDPFFKDYHFSDNTTRNLRSRGMSINEQGTTATQLCTINSHVENIFRYYKNALVCRCALDALCYTEYLYRRRKVEEWVYDYARNVFKFLLPNYAFIFYLEPEFGIQDDGVRSVSREFQYDIMNIFRCNIQRYNINVIKIGGTIEERCQQILTTIK